MAIAAGGQPIEFVSTEVDERVAVWPIAFAKELPRAFDRIVRDLLDELPDALIRGAPHLDNLDTHLLTPCKARARHDVGSRWRLELRASRACVGVSRIRDRLVDCEQKRA
jgi:hypothetical protein